MRLDGRRAFSLVELLLVIVIIATLVVLSAPAVFDLIGSRGTTRAVNEISDLIEMARNEAMTRQSYTWVAFDAATNADGNDELHAAVLSVLDGVVSTTSKGTTVAISTARPVTRTFRWENVKLVPLSALKHLRNLAQAPSEPLASQARQSFRLGAASMEMTEFLTITFTPQGYALLKGLPDLLTPYAEFIDIGLQPTRGGEKLAKPDQAALVLDGVNGRIAILRR